MYIVCRANPKFMLDVHQAPFTLLSHVSHDHCYVSHTSPRLTTQRLQEELQNTKKIKAVVIDANTRYPHCGYYIVH